MVVFMLLWPSSSCMKRTSVPLQQMSGKAVAQAVDAHCFGHVGFGHRIFKNLLHAPGGVGAAILPFEQIFFWPVRFKVLAQLL